MSKGKGRGGQREGKGVKGERKKGVERRRWKGKEGINFTHFAFRTLAAMVHNEQIQYNDQHTENSTKILLPFS